MKEPLLRKLLRKSELMGVLNEEEKKAVHCGEVTDDDFRLWSNPELYMNPGTFTQFQCQF